MDKKQKKLSVEIDRSSSKQVEYASLNESLDTQMKGFDYEKAKANSRIDIADQKLQALVSTLQDKYGFASTAGQKEALPPPDTGTESSSPDLGGRLMALQKAMSEAFQSQLSREINKVKEELVNKHEKETQEFKRLLNQENDRNLSLENKLATLEKKVDGIAGNNDQRIQQISSKIQISSSNNAQALNNLREGLKDHAQQLSELTTASKLASSSAKTDNSQLKGQMDEQDKKINFLTSLIQPALLEVEATKNKASKQHQINEATDTKVALIEKAMETTKTSLEGKADAGAMTTNFQDMKHELEGFQDAIGRDEDQRASIAKEMASLKSIVSALPVNEITQVISQFPKMMEGLATRSPTVSQSSTPDTKIMEAVDTKVKAAEARMTTKFRQDFDQIATGFGTLIDKQRKAQTELELKLQGTDGCISESRRELGELGSGHAKAFKDLDDRMRATASDMATHKQDVSSMSGQLEEIRTETQGGFRSLQVQLGHFTSWKNNFSTKAFYTQIVEHINANNSNGIPSSMIAQVKRISERVDSLESGGSDAAKKKRKVSNGNAMIVNSNH